MKRKYGLDLLKIIATLFIMILHINRKGLLNTDDNTVYYVVKSLDLICFCAVNIYGIITGYLSYSSYEKKKDDKYNFKKLVYLWLIVFTYGFITYMVFFICGWCKINPKNVVTMFLPVTTNKIWYFTQYFILFFFMPFINIFVYKTDNKKLFTTLISIFIFIVCYQTFVSNVYVGFAYLNNGYSAWWLFILYYIGACMKKLKLFDKVPSWKLILVLVITYIVSIVWSILMPEYYEKLGGFMYTYHSPNIVIEAIIYVQLFSRVTFKSDTIKTLLPKLSVACFGAYVMHVHALLWENTKTLFEFLLDYSVYAIPMLEIGLALITLTIMLIIDISREYIFMKLKIGKFSEKIANVINKIIDIISMKTDYEK